MISKYMLIRGELIIVNMNNSLVSIDYWKE